MNNRCTYRMVVVLFEKMISVALNDNFADTIILSQQWWRLILDWWGLKIEHFEILYLSCSDLPDLINPYEKWQSECKIKSKMNLTSGNYRK